MNGTTAARSQSARYFVVVAVIATALWVLTGCTGGKEPAKLADGFPTAIPVIDGTLTASEKSGIAYNATVKVSDEKAQQKALDDLTAKGFVVTGSSGTDSSDRVYSLANNDYSVRLGFEHIGNDLAVQYGVSPRGGK